MRSLPSSIYSYTLVFSPIFNCYMAYVNMAYNVAMNSCIMSYNKSRKKNIYYNKKEYKNIKKYNKSVRNLPPIRRQWKSIQFPNNLWGRIS